MNDNNNYNLNCEIAKCANNMNVNVNMRTFGVTAPISVSEPKEIDLLMTKQLEECLRSFDLFESEGEIAHRMNVLANINQLMDEWIKEVSAKKMPQQNAETMTGKLFTFGSYRLGVHTKGADIDTLIVAPRHIERSDFFTTFHEKLLKRCEYARAVEEAFVPVIKTKIDGIELDILFARLALKNIPHDQELRDGNLLKNLDERSVRSLNGSRVTDDILSLVPNQESFRLALRAVKHWAKRKGIYSNSLGYLGGVSWAMLVARTCQLYPRACAATLLQKFFLVFRQWPWPKPVLLRHNGEDNPNLGFPVWDPRVNPSDRYHLMPIITPSYPQQNSTFNVTNSTKAIMTNEFRSASEVIDNICDNKSNWNCLFESVNFFQKYRHFIVLMATSRDEWIGLVESKIRILVQNLERHRCITLAHVNPKQYKRIEQQINVSEHQIDSQTSPDSTDNMNVKQNMNINSNTVNINDSNNDNLNVNEDNNNINDTNNTNNDDNSITNCDVICDSVLWFIGLEFNKSECEQNSQSGQSVDLTNDIRTFVDTVNCAAKLSKISRISDLNIDSKHVKRKELGQYLPPEVFRAPKKNKNSIETNNSNNSSQQLTPTTQLNNSNATECDSSTQQIVTTNESEVNSESVKRKLESDANESQSESESKKFAPNVTETFET